ncbi:nSTAND1 domain-containing NTPase, partial [Streptomyces sp. NPDC002073]
MGRLEKPLDPAGGPTAALAAALRELRRSAGSPTYAAMARRAGTYSVATLSRAASGEQLPTLPVLLAYAAACGGDPDHWRARWQHAADELAALAAEHHDEPAPYRGLARYEPGDRDLYFGRDRLVDDLTALTREHRVVAVFGPSGSGKSSLLRAGLAPRLRAPGSTATAVRLLTPGARPLDRHRGNLAPADGPGDTWLIVDQFEEVFTLCTDGDERALFIKELLHTAQGDTSRVRVVLGIRADFYAHCLGDPALASAVRAASLPVVPMTRDELRQAIVGPAAARSLVVERPLTARLVDEVHGNTAALPLLSHTLLETWHRRTARRLTLEAYERTGGVHGAIARTAETAYGRLDAAQARIARRILLRLVRPGGEGLPDTGRPAHRAELGPDDEVRHVLDALATSRLVTLDRDTVELSHETLIASWPRLHDWVDDSREQLRLHHRLTAAAESWEQLGRHPSALAPAALLTALSPLLPDAGPQRLTPSETEYLTASTRARTLAAARRRAAQALLALISVLALIAGTVAWQAGRTARERRDTAVALRTAAVAEGLRATDPRTAARLNVVAWRLARTPQTRAGLFAALGDRTESVLTLGDGNGRARSEFASEDGRTLTVVGRQTVALWDLRARSRLSSYRLPMPVRVPVGPYAVPELLPPSEPGPSRPAEPASVQPVPADPPERVRSSPDGTRSATISQGGGPANTTRRWAEVRLRDLRTATETALVLYGVHAATGLAWGGGRTLAVAAPGTVRLWDVGGRRPLFAVPAARASTGVALSADGRRAALCGRRGIEVWDVPGRRRLAGGSPAVPHVPAGTCGTDSMRLSPDGAWLAVRLDTGVLVSSTKHGGPPARVLPAAGVTGFSFNRDGTLLAAVTPQAARVWRTADDRPVPLAFYQDLRHDRPTDVRIDDRAGLLRYVHADQRRVGALRLGPMHDAAWSPQGSDAVHPSPDGSATIVLRRKGGSVVPELYAGAAGTGGRGDPLTASARPTARLPVLSRQAAGAHTGPVTGAFSPDGRLFAYGPTARRKPLTETVKVWDVRRGKPLPDVVVPKTAPGVPGTLTVTALAPVLRDGKPVVYAGCTAVADRSAWLCDLTGSRLVHPLGQDTERIVVRPDGGALVLPDGAVSALPGERTDKVAGLVGSEFAAAFRPDGRRLAQADGS